MNEAESPVAQPKRRIPEGVWVIAILGGIGLFGLLFAVVGSGDSYDPNNPLEVKAQCEGFVKARLKAPSTADFELSAVQAGTGWTVTGTVDSENSFGGNLRSPVRCVLHFEGDTAHLDDISVG